jgi:senataxin
MADSDPKQEMLRRAGLSPCMFFDISSREERIGRSLSNTAEASLICRLVLKLYSITTSRNQELFAEKVGSIAIISPYKLQVNCIRHELSKTLPDHVAKNIEVNTVDSFQGREKDIVFFSCVRSGNSSSRSIGFLSDKRRLNVAITRAKNCLVIVGDAQRLSIDATWDDFIFSMKSRGCLKDGKL